MVPIWLRIVALCLAVVGAIIQGWRTGVKSEERPEWAVYMAYILLTLGASLFNLRQHVAPWKRVVALALLASGAGIQAWRSGLPAEKRPKFVVEVGFFLITMANILFNWSDG